MAVLGTIALIALVILGIMVLRVKSDPLEKESVRKYLTESKGTKASPSSDASRESELTPTPPKK
jgi:hypothetical protein